MEYCILLIIIVILIIFGICCFCYKKEQFTDKTQNCPQPLETLLSPKITYGEPWTPQGYKNFNGYIAGSYSPGSVFKCKDLENCPNITVRGCSKKEKIPIIKNNLPLGWGSTITGPYAGNTCMSNINGINKVSMTNPYSNEMYSFCEKGISNCFDD